MKTKRNTKDSIFTALFSDPIYQLQLYKEFHPDEDVTVEDIHDVTLEYIFTVNMVNDLSFTVKDRILFLVEAQSTWSENIIYRILFYYAEVMKKRIDEKEENIYSSKKITPLNPEFYVIYTGDKKVEHEISLTSSFFNSQPSDLEVKVHVISQVANLSYISNQYISFCNIFDNQRKIHKYKTETIEETIKICKNKGILLDFITSKESEVTDTMAFVYDQAYATRMTLRDMRDEIKEQVKQEVKEQVKEEVKEQVKQEVKEQVKQEVKEEIKQEIKEQILKELPDIDSGTLNKIVNNLLEKK